MVKTGRKLSVRPTSGKDRKLSVRPTSGKDRQKAVSKADQW